MIMKVTMKEFLKKKKHAQMKRKQSKNIQSYTNRSNSAENILLPLSGNCIFFPLIFPLLKRKAQN